MIGWPIAELLPHAGERILLDAVLAFDAESILCQRRVAPGNLTARCLPGSGWS